MGSGWQHAWRRGGPIDWTLRVLCALYMFLLIDSGVEQLVRAMPGTPLTTFGHSGGSFDLDGSAKPFLSVGQIAPGSSAARAGIKVGDRINLPAYRDFAPTFVVGETVEVIVDHAGVRRHIAVPIAKMPRAPIVYVFARLSTVFVIAIAAFLFVRGWWQPVPMLMALGLTGPTSVFVLFVLPVWLRDSFGVSAFLFALMRCVTLVALVGLPAFAMRLYEEQHRRLPHWHWVMLATLTVGFAWDALLLNAVPVLGLPLELRGREDLIANLSVVLSQLCFVAAGGYLIAGWFRSRGSARNQYRILLIAFAVPVLAILIDQAANLFGASSDTDALSVKTINVMLGSALYAALLAYAMLRQKLVDVGFVLNRTLVYGSVSAILLVTFGLTEWAADELIKEQSRVESVLIEAGIAVGIFLVFHRVRDFVEEHLEAFFFRSWHANEAALKRFVADAAHIRRPEALKAGLVAELRRFSGGAAVGLYLPIGEQGFGLGGGDAAMPLALDIDDPVLVRLRASGERVEPADLGSPLPAALALPMFHRADLIGLVLLGAKPDGDGYRPDETAALANAVRSVGLDLDALRIEELEAEAANLRSRLMLAEARRVPAA